MRWRLTVAEHFIWSAVRYGINVPIDSILADIEHKKIGGEYSKILWIIPTSDNFCSINSYSHSVKITHRINSCYGNVLMCENGLAYEDRELTTSKHAAYHLAFQKFPHAKFLIERAYES